MTRTVRLACAALAWFTLRSAPNAAPPADLGEAAATGDVVQLRAGLAADLRIQIKRSPSAQAEYADRLAVWRFIQTVGPAAVDQIRSQPDGAEFVKWLVQNPRVLEDYLSNGALEEYNAAGLEVWRRIWSAHPESREGVLLKLAEACGLTFAVPFNSQSGKPVDPVARFAFFAKSYRDGVLFPYFDKERTWEMRHVVCSVAADEEMSWVRGKVGAGERNQARIGIACYLVPYREKNDKGVSVQDNARYYGFRPVTLQLMFEVGGVCGAQAAFGVAAAQAFGIPSMPVGQPFHCALMWRDAPGSWIIGNDGCGWAQSTPGGRIMYGPRPSLMWLIDAAMADPQAYSASQRYRWAAELFADDQAFRLYLLRQSAGACPTNYPAVLGYISVAKESLGPGPYIAVLKGACDGLKDHPFAIADTLRDKMGLLLEALPDDPRTRSVLESGFQAIADGSASRQVGCALWAIAELHCHVLRTFTKSDFDFGAPLRDGKDAGGVWEKLNAGQRGEWLKGIEAVLRTCMKRRDIYAAPLELYVALSAKTKADAAHGAYFLGPLARRAVASGISPFGADACNKLAALSEVAWGKAAADEWRRLAPK